MYFPLEKGLYEVAPGLRPFGTNLGQGALDSCVFQFEQTPEATESYLRNKAQGRAENREKYFLTHEFSPALEKTVTA